MLLRVEQTDRAARHPACISTQNQPRYFVPDFITCGRRGKDLKTQSIGIWVGRSRDLMEPRVSGWCLREVGTTRRMSVFENPEEKGEPILVPCLILQRGKGKDCSAHMKESKKGRSFLFSFRLSGGEPLLWKNYSEPRDFWLTEEDHLIGVKSLYLGNPDWS